jgi:hypothetical protein
MSKRLEEHILDKIGRIGDIAGPARQPAMSPALQGIGVASKEGLQSALIASSGPHQELHCGIGIRHASES